MEAIDFVRDECRGFPLAVAEDQSVETAVFAPDDPNFFAGTRASRTPLPVQPPSARADRDPQDPLSRTGGRWNRPVLDLEPGRLRAGRGRWESRNAAHPEDGESERSRAPAPQVRRELRQGSHRLEEAAIPGSSVRDSVWPFEWLPSGPVDGNSVAL